MGVQRHTPGTHYPLPHHQSGASGRVVSIMPRLERPTPRGASPPRTLQKGDVNACGSGIFPRKGGSWYTMAVGDHLTLGRLNRPPGAARGVGGTALRHVDAVIADALVFGRTADH